MTAIVGGQRRNSTAPLALTMGDPAGIGIEITLKAWLQRAAHKLSPFCVYANAEAFEDRGRALGLNVPIVKIEDPSRAMSIFTTSLPIIDLPLGSQAQAGKPTNLNASATIASITRAVEAVAHGHVRAVVTNPIAKSVLYEAGFKHPGHTEFLAELASRYWPGRTYQPVMMLACETLKVVPLTIHVPLALVPALVTRELIVKTVRITAASLTRDFGVTNPRIAVAGLNPHAGEGGTIGTEDRDIIAPALEALAGEGFNVVGPLSADTLFHASARKTYDVAIAMYHDQALIPIKTLAFDEGVNVTLGLPFIRTSPDHGTAFDIATQGSASPRSLIEALKLADLTSSMRERATS